MKRKCPKCGHCFDDGAQSKAAKARWKHTSKKDRFFAARSAAVARWKTKKATGPQNNKISHARQRESQP